ncbi:MAG: hypothetical protein M1822_003683 [Bathelium mastoideum]|nr:MAG: hypothetical protein M1822_003683 [Bathelium mastoideum]
MLFREELGPDEVGEQEVDPFITFSFDFDLKEPRIEFSAKVSWLKDSLPFKEVQIHVSDQQSRPRWWAQFLEDSRSDLLVEPWRVRIDEFPSRDIPANTGDVEVSRLALGWLRTCRSRHLTCDVVDERRDSDFFPPRLLKVSHGEPQACHLLVPREESPVKGSRYVALSHCWGTNSPTMTLTAYNLDRMKENIPLSSLPKSFLEAIQVCQRLEFEYIWIDCLCIIQSGPGSEEDWQLHVAIMDVIYAKCELNIAVARASDSTQGCFVDRDPDFIQTAYVYAPVAMGLDQLTMDPSDQAMDSSDEAMDSSDQAMDSSDEAMDSSDEAMDSSDEAMDSSDEAELSALHEDSFDQNTISHRVTIFAGHHDFMSTIYLEHPLLRRAWVFQERVMAPRTLHFGKDRIFWECNEKVLNEYLPWGLPFTGATFSTDGALAFSLPAMVLRSEATPHLDQATIDYLQQQWHSFTDDYSSMNLTYPEKDKLTAISAIAKRFGQVLPGLYAAGHFLSSNPLGLLWDNANGLDYKRTNEAGWKEEISIDTERDTVYRAPSWSWASVDGRTTWWVDYDAHRWGQQRQPSQRGPQILAELKSIFVELVEPSNPYGQLRSAEIIVNGPISSIQPPREQDMGKKAFTKWPESFDERNSFFFLYFLTMKYNQMRDFRPHAFGVILTAVSGGMYRRVGLITRIGPDDAEFEFDKMDRANVRIV